MITLLRDSDVCIQKAATAALFKLSEYSKRINLSDLALFTSLIAQFQPSISTGLPDIIRLLNDRDDNIRKAGLNTLSKLSDRGKIVTLSDLALLISILADFRPLIGTAIRDIVILLKDRHRHVRRAGADAVSKLSEHGKSLDL